MCRLTQKAKFHFIISSHTCLSQPWPHQCQVRILPNSEPLELEANTQTSLSGLAGDAFPPQKLLRQAVRFFYPPHFAPVVDVLCIHRCMRQADVVEILRYNDVTVRSLRTSHIIPAPNSHMRPGYTDPDQAREGQVTNAGAHSAIHHCGFKAPLLRAYQCSYSPR